MRQRAWRAVEAQHIVATRRLVDSAEEQQLLEELLERHKPPRPAGPEFRGLHYLLYTPFRYPPLLHGSRFAGRAERGLWYGAKLPRTVFAEVAYYRLLFLAGTTAELDPVAVELSAFQVSIRTRRGVDLTQPPFDDRAGTISAPDRYEASQRLGREMRADGVEAFRYRSARDRLGGLGVALFSPRAFESKRPEQLETWYCVASRDGVEFSRIDFFEKRSYRYPREDFEIGGALPAPAP